MKDTGAILIAAPYFPPHVGGLEEYVRSLAHGLQSYAGERVVVATTGRRGALHVERSFGEGLVVYRLPVIGKVSNTPIGVGWLHALRRIIVAERVGLVNAHAPVPVFADVASLAARDLPFVLTYHAGPMRKGQRLLDPVVGIYEHMVLPRTAARADRIICSSDWVRFSFAGAFGPRARTIPPGVDVKAFRPGGQGYAGRILFVGSLDRVSRRKGLDDLFAAVRVLRRDRPAVRVAVIGDGDGRGEYARMSRDMGIDDIVSFEGAVGRADLVGAYQAAAVVALPTRYDSFPTVLAEAMACGRPVVSTTVGGVPSLVNDNVNGLLVPPSDSPALAAALARVLDDASLARRLGEAARERVSSDLSWELQTSRTVAVFEEARGRAREQQRRPALRVR